MIGSQDRWQEDLFVACPLRDLIPEDHVLRRIDRVLDLAWLREEVAECYSEAMGRPSIDPEAAVRLMLAGFVQGIVHDRALMREAQVNLAIRWFAGYRLHERLPDHSSLTRLRQRWGVERFAAIFERTVEACARAGLVEGDVLHIDATLVRADADLRRVARTHAERVWRAHAADEEPPPERPPDPPPTRGRQIDRDATLGTSDHRVPPRPSYKQHSAVDSRAGVVVDVEVTTGAVREVTRIVGQVERVCERLGRAPRVVTADRGYSSGSVCAALEAHGTAPVIVPRPEPRTARRIAQRRFAYDERHDIVRCPEGKVLRRLSHRRRRGGCVYAAARRDCAGCRLEARCVDASSGRRTVEIAPGHSALLRHRRRHARRDPGDQALHRRHRALAEGCHAEAKGCHGLARAARRAVGEVAIQSYLTAAVMNLKRLAAAAARRLGALLMPETSVAVQTVT